MPRSTLGVRYPPSPAYKMCMTPIYFVFPASHRAGWSEPLKEAACGRCSVNEAAPYFKDGKDVFLLQAWMLLRGEETPFSFHLVERAVPKQICVFHYDTARIKHGLFDCFSIVIRVDRPAVPYADIIAEQHPVLDNPVRYLPHWVQPGITRREAARENRLERVALVGNRQYHPAFVSDPYFLERLAKLGIKLVALGPDAWTNFADIDAVVALRPWIAPRVLRTKPPVKLLNAWAAGTPALLGPEPAYRALRLDPLDYLEVTGPESVLSALRQLKETPGLYAAMRERCQARADEYAWENVKGKWLDLFTYAVSRKNAPTPGIVCKFARYQAVRAYNSVLRRTGLWND